MADDTEIPGFYDPTLKFTPVDTDPFAAAQQYAASLPTPDQDVSTHWATPQPPTDISTQQTWQDKLHRAWALPGKVATALPQALLDQGTGLASTAIGAATLSGDVAQGKVDPLSQQGIQRSTDLAGMLTSPALEATPAVADTAGIFAGAKSQTADLNALKHAQLMDAVGADKTEIWDKTGWFTGQDGKWRYEIPDDNMSITAPAWKDLHVKGGVNAPISNVFEHDDLYSAYPELSNIHTEGRYTPAPTYFNNVTNQHETIPTSGSGYFGMRGGEPEIGFDSPTTDLNSPHSPASIGSHELQHAVQNLEGFTFGSNPKMFENHPDLNEFGPYSMYHRTAGEVEARNVQRRLNWSLGQRQDTPPWASEDVPHNMQIIVDSVDHDPFHNFTPVENNPFE